ncbi:Crp/Fnr family transcriptional regulator, partial [Streptococcus pyogenes]
LYLQNIQAASNIGYSVKERLATHILSIENEGKFQLELHLLPDSFGTSYRHLLRTIKDFLEEKTIAKERKNYHILQRKTLEKLRIRP